MGTMKKKFNIQMISVLVLLSVVIALSRCKKGDDSSSSALSPVATTSTASWVGHTWASLKGTANAKNQSTIVTFEYDTTTTYNHTVSANPDTVSGSTTTIVNAVITGLKSSTTYYFRVKAVNQTGTTYGSDVTFTTSGASRSKITFNPDISYGSVSDNNGNTYKTVRIGSQTWMAENLKSIKLNDGTDIPFVAEETDWDGLSAAGYCWYNNDSVNYGALYNWYAVNTGKLCPSGWHVPTDSEFTLLSDYLGGENVAGYKQKETGTIHWLSPNSSATNESGFTALPGGYRNYNGIFNSIKRDAFWWTFTESPTTDAYIRNIYYGYSSMDRNKTNKNSGLSVRCLMD
jgi:uncharacterized protein (TIGR02145 family)